MFILQKVRVRFQRLYTREGADPFDTTAWRSQTDADGNAYVLPASWGGMAPDLLAEKIFAPRPPASALKPQSGGSVPDWLRPQVCAPDAPRADWQAERDLRDVLHRVAGGLCYTAFRAGLFDDAADARVFYDELRHIMLHRLALPEVSLLATAGLEWAYGADAARAFIPAERIAELPADFALPQMPHGTLAVTSKGAKGDLPRRLRLLADIHALENPSAAPLRAVVPVEELSAAALIAAQTEEEIDALARDLGRRLMDEAAARAVDACDRDALRGFDTAYNGKLSRTVRELRAAGAPETLLRRAIDYAQQGYEQLSIQREDNMPLAPQPVHITLSVGDDFIETALTGHGFLLRAAGEDAEHVDASDMWLQMGDALWASGQPDLFFRDSASETPGDIYAAQGLISPAGVEAPGAVLNLAAFTAANDMPDALIDHAAITHAARLMVAALDAACDSRGLSPHTAARRPVCLGFSGLAGVLMSAGVAYDSDAARTLGAQVTALVSGAAYLASAEMADRLGAYDEYAAESRERLSGVKNRIAALSGARGTAKGVMRRLPVLNDAISPDKTLAPVIADVWARAYAIAREQGLRHAHVSCLATALDVQALLGVTCRDITPEAAPVRFEGFFGDSAGAGNLYGKKLNPAIPRALKRLGYTARQIDDIHSYAVGHGTLLDAPAINHQTLAAKGMSPAMIVAAEKLLPAAQDLRYVFNRWTLGEGADELPIGDAEDILAALGFSEDDIDDASLHACGAMTLEGAPHLLPEHLDVFDCLLPSGSGIRRVGAPAQIAMQAAVEPFLCGAVAQTLILDHHTPIDEMQKLALSAWEQGVRRLSLWREGASLLQPAELLPEKWETSLFAEEEEERGIHVPATTRKPRRARS